MSMIIINDDLRTMQIPSGITLLGVESDDDVNVIQFQMPKEYCGTDLSTFEARINYMNAGGIGDLYIADDLTVDGDNITFSWVVGRTACAYKGDVKFIVCLKKFDQNDVVVQEFNTTVYSLPVLEGLETTEVVVQQYPDIIEHMLTMIREAGIVDFNNYYTKAETDALKLANPHKLTINGTEYDGSEPVEVTIDASAGVLRSGQGQIIHIEDALPKAVKTLKVYDSNNTELSAATIAVANRNLFRIDLLGSSVTDKGITFTKDADGGITVSGTSTGTYPMTTCALDPKMLAVGETYTLSSHKWYGQCYVALVITYTDNSTETIVSRNSSRTFKITKPVSSVVGSVQLSDSGVTVDDEKVYPMLECAAGVSPFVMNTYASWVYDGIVMPVLPDAICNIWSPDAAVTSIFVEYYGDMGLQNNDYDLIIESVASINFATATPAHFQIVKGSILDCEELIAESKPVKGLCILHQSWSSHPSEARSGAVTWQLPLTFWQCPYTYMSFGGVYGSGISATAPTVLEAVFGYNSDGTISRVAITSKQLT